MRLPIALVAVALFAVPAIAQPVVTAFSYQAYVEYSPGDALDFAVFSVPCEGASRFAPADCTEVETTIDRADGTRQTGLVYERSLTVFYRKSPEGPPASALIATVPAPTPDGVGVGAEFDSKFDIRFQRDGGMPGELAFTHYMDKSSANLGRDDVLRVSAAPAACPSPRGTFPTETCVEVWASIERADGTLEDMDLDGIDDIGLWIPAEEAICLGSDDCDWLLAACEQEDGCDFTCHVAVPNPDGQACVFGSTD